MLDEITPVVLTYNEAPNIGRTLDALRWAKRVIVMDSFSTDSTQAICQQYPNTVFIQRTFDQHAKQWNAAIKQNITTQWTLALDADHILSENLITELSVLHPEQHTQGYWASFTYKIRGKPLTGSLYPAVLSLYRTGAGEYQQDGHTQRLVITGQLDTLQGKIFHDDRKPWKRWLKSQSNYAAQEAEKLTNSTFSSLPIQDKLRYLGLAPLIIFPYTLVFKKLIVNGLPGLEYSTQRFIAECYLQIARLQRLRQPKAR